MSKSASMVYNEWAKSLLKGFTNIDLNVCPAGSVFYLGRIEDRIMPLFVARTLGGELFHTWYSYYSDLVSKAPVGSIPIFTHYYAVSPIERESACWSADEFCMESIAGKAYCRPVLGKRAYEKLTLPSVESVVLLCNKTRQN